jgi:hypothetical protein
MVAFDWVTVASLATAGATLVLALATFAAVRSANRAARTAERALLVGMRPLLLASRPQDDVQKVTWQDEHYTRLDGGRGAVEVVDGNIYMAISLRNAGSGAAVLDAWHLWTEVQLGRQPPPDTSEFRRLTRDLYVPPGDIGFWQGAVRERDDPLRAPLEAAIASRNRMMVDILHGDQEGGQRTITRFALTPIPDGGYLAITSRQWNLDRDDPR